MTNHEKEFENFVRQTEFDDAPDSHHRDTLEHRLLLALKREPSAQTALWRTVIKSPVTKIAVAAAIILMAIWVGSRVFNGRVEQPEKEFVTQRDPRRKGPLIEERHEDKPDSHVPDESRLAADRLSQELEDVQLMFAAGDVDGLVAALSEARFDDSSILAANYLAKIGDARAIDALVKLSKDWEGDPADNPFAGAIVQILDRLRPTEQPADTEQETDSKLPGTTVTGAMAENQELVTYRGLVTDQGRIPLAGVAIWSYSGSYAEHESLFEPRPIEAEAVTDSNGTFILGPVAAIKNEMFYRHLVFEHPNYAVGWITLGGRIKADPNTLRVTLFDPAVFAGRVVDSYGEPIAEVVVEAQLQVITDDRSYSGYFDLTELNGLAVHTDAQGYFAFENIPYNAKLHIRLRHEDYGLYVSRNEHPGDWYPFRPGQDVVITLEAGTYIKGHLVKNGSRYEKEGLMITAREDKKYGWAFTDKRGNFDIRSLSAGNYVVAAEHQQLSSSSLVCKPTENVHVSPAEPATGVAVELFEGRLVIVRVVDMDMGEPVKKQRVLVTGRADKLTEVASGQTDKSGQCTIYLPTGDYNLRTTGWKNGSYHQFDKDFTVKPDGTDCTVEIGITPRPFIYGWLVDANDNPVPGTVILDEPVQTDQHGEFAIPEPWTDFTEKHVGFAFDTENKIGTGFFWTKSDEPNDVELVLQPLVTVTGRLIDKDGVGLGDVKPQINILMDAGSSRGTSGKLWRTTVDPNGWFTIEGIPSGLPMKVLADKPGTQGSAELPLLEPGAVIDVGDLVLRPLHGFDTDDIEWTGTLRGRVVNENSEPMVGLRVKTGMGLKTFGDTTDTRGRYTLKGLPKGKKISGSIYADGYGHTMFTTVVDGNDLDIHLVPEGWDLLDRPAPPLSVEKWLNTEPLTLEQYRGKVVLLQIGVLLPNYSAQFDQVTGLLERYGGKGLELIAIHQPLRVDWAGEVTEKDLVDFIQEKKVEFPFAIDGEPDRGNGATYGTYGVKACPALYLIGKQGRVRVSPTGKNIDAWIKRLLAE
jgi:hypothetical protein